jgi:hypothetical protein
MVNTTAAVPEEQRFILSSLSPSPTQRCFAGAVVVALLLAFVVTVGPLSKSQLAR